LLAISQPFSATVARIPSGTSAAGSKRQREMMGNFGDAASALGVLRLRKVLLEIAAAMEHDDSEAPPSFPMIDTTWPRTANASMSTVRRSSSEGTMFQGAERYSFCRRVEERRDPRTARAFSLEPSRRSVGIAAEKLRANCRGHRRIRASGPAPHRSRSRARRAGLERARVRPRAPGRAGAGVHPAASPCCCAATRRWARSGLPAAPSSSPRWDRPLRSTGRARGGRARRPR